MLVNGGTRECRSVEKRAHVKGGQQTQHTHYTLRSTQGLLLVNIHNATAVFVFVSLPRHRLWQ